MPVGPIPGVMHVDLRGASRKHVTMKAWWTRQAHQTEALRDLTPFLREGRPVPAEVIQHKAAHIGINHRHGEHVAQRMLRILRRSGYRFCEERMQFEKAKG